MSHFTEPGPPTKAQILSSKNGWVPPIEDDFDFTIAPPPGCQDYDDTEQPPEVPGHEAQA